MTYLADQFAGGIDPLQNFDVKSIPIETRKGRVAGRISGHDSAGRPIIEQDSVGDVRNAILWAAGSRAMGAWSHATPVRGGSPVHASGGNFSDPALVAKENQVGGPGAGGGKVSPDGTVIVKDGVTWKKIGGQFYFWDNKANTWRTGMAQVGGGWGAEFGLNSDTQLIFQPGRDNSPTGWSWQYPAIGAIGPSVGMQSDKWKKILDDIAKRTVVGAQGQGGAVGNAGPAGSVQPGMRSITGGGSGPTFTATPIRGEYQGDGTLVPKTVQLPAGFPSLAGGSVGTVIGGTEHLYEAPVYLHGDPRLVSVNEGPDPTASSVVLDTDGSGNLNPGLSAPLHSAWRVVDPIFSRTTTGARGTLAWQLARGERDGVAGYGAIVDTSVRGLSGSGRAPTTTSGSNGSNAGTTRTVAGGATQGYNKGQPYTSIGPTVGDYGVPIYTPMMKGPAAPPAALGAGRDDTPALCIGLTSARVGGPLEVGHGKVDKHRIGTSGSRATNVGHLNTGAPFFKNALMDAPLDFETAFYPKVGQYPMSAEAHIQYHATRTHSIPGKSGIPGLWKVWAEVPFVEDGGFRTRKKGGTDDPVPEPKDPIPDDPPITPTEPKPPKPPPPTTPSDQSPPAPPPSSGAGAAVGGKRREVINDYSGEPWDDGEGPPFGNGHDWGWSNGGTYSSPYVQPSASGGKTNKVVVHPGVEAFTAVTWKPQGSDNTTTDLRGATAVSQDAIIKQLASRPTTMRLEAYGGQIGTVWSRTQTRGSSRYVGGTGPGGVVFMPPENDILDVGRSGWTPAQSTSYVGAMPSVYFAVGLPKTDTGGWKTGTRWGADTSGNSVFSAMSSAGVATPALTIDTTGGVTLGAKFALAGVLSPAQITSTQNNYNPTGLASAAILRLNTDAARSISGLAGGTDDRMLVVTNVGAFKITLGNEAVASTAANRFLFGSDIALQPEQSIWLTYDNASARWRALGRMDASRDVASGIAGLNASSRITKGAITTDDLIVDDATKGLVLKDNAGTPHYWRVSVSTAGVLSTADLGTTAP